MTHQYIGRNSTSPGPTTASKPLAFLNFGNLSKSGLSKSTCMKIILNDKYAIVQSRMTESVKPNSWIPVQLWIWSVTVARLECYAYFSTNRIFQIFILLNYSFFIYHKSVFQGWTNIHMVTTCRRVSEFDQLWVTNDGFKCFFLLQIMDAYHTALNH